MFFEVIIAKGINSEAKEILSKKENLRILIADFNNIKQQDIKTVSGGILVQDLDQKQISVKDLIKAGKETLNDNELEDLIFAMNICKHVKSNAIIVCQDKQAIGIGAGQMSRVDACHLACNKASEFVNSNNNFNPLFLASDAFFPFSDNIEIAHKYNIKAAIAPRGSIQR